MPIPVPLKMMKVGYKFNSGWTVVRIDEIGVHSDFQWPGYSEVYKCIHKWDGERQVIHIDANPDFNKNDEEYKKWVKAYSELLCKWMKISNEDRLTNEEKIKKNTEDFDKAVSEICKKVI